MNPDDSSSAAGSKPKRGCLGKILKTVCFLIVLFLLVPAVLPRHVHVERSADITASPEAAFALVSDQSQEPRWSPWIEMDPDTVTQVTGTGVGSVYEFNSKKVGTGSSTIVSMEAPKFVKYHLEMVKPMPGHFDAGMQIEPTATGCRLTWTYDQDPPYLMRYPGLLMDQFLGAPYATGVANLKKLLETKP
jgi:hypothetical protein